LGLPLAPDTPDEEVTWPGFKHWAEDMGGAKGVVAAVQNGIVLPNEEARRRAGPWVASLEAANRKGWVGIGAQFAPRVCAALRRACGLPC